MTLLEEIALVPLEGVLTYAVLTIAGTSVTLYYLSKVFDRRHGPAVWLAYFAMKGYVDACVYWTMTYGHPGLVLYDFSGLWTSVTSVVSLFVIFYTFRGDYVQVALCAVASDLFASVLNPLCQTLGNLVSGVPYDTGYFDSPSLRTLLVCVVLLLCLTRLFTAPLVGLLSYLSRVALRHRLIWSGVVIVGIATFTSVLNEAARSGLTINHVGYNYPFMVFALALLCFLLVQRRRDVDRRRQTLEECLALARSYDRVVGEQLATLERDRAALEGHEISLRRIGDVADDRGLAQRVSGLERTYRRLRAGSYCTQPALDAVLISCAARLRAQGVEPIISVAGVPTGASVPTAMVLTLLNLALEAAERTPSVEGSQLELRVRGVGGQLFLRLDVPARWGALGVRRFLAPHMRDRTGTVRERRHGDRTVALVITGTQAS